MKSPPLRFLSRPEYLIIGCLVFKYMSVYDYMNIIYIYIYIYRFLGEGGVGFCPADHESD